MSKLASKLDRISKLDPDVASLFGTTGVVIILVILALAITPIIQSYQTPPAGCTVVENGTVLLTLQYPDPYEGTVIVTNDIFVIYDGLGIRDRSGEFYYRLSVGDGVSFTEPRQRIVRCADISAGFKSIPTYRVDKMPDMPAP